MFQTVKRGDILFVRVLGHIRKVLHLVKVQAMMGNKIRDISYTNIKVGHTQPERILLNFYTYQLPLHVIVLGIILLFIWLHQYS